MSRRPDLRGPQPVLPPERLDQVRALLERILSSHHFRGSQRCQSLLRHITAQTLAGNGPSLKERTLGAEVFGREPDYDTSQDPVVRTTAAEIRKRLAQYYQEPGQESEARIELPSGSYVVEFHFNGTGATSAKGRWRHWGAAIFAAAALVAILAAGWALERPKRSALEELWAPLLRVPGPALVCVGQPIVYNLKSTYAQDAIQGIVAAQQPGEPAARQDAIPKKDLLILSDRYVDLGDAVCLAHLASLLESHGKLYHIRGERSTTFADLSDGPSILIGAFNNQWTLRTDSQLRFTFFKDSVNEIDMVRDRQHPEGTPWRLKGAWPYWDVPTDYAIASRFFDTTTNRPVIIAAGITRYGTIAAGEFLTNAEYFGEAEARFPSGWQKKNLQVVLSVPVVKGVAGRPKVVATHVW